MTSSLDFSHFGRDWVAAFAVILCTFALASATRAILRRAGKNRRLSFLSELAPSLSNLIYIVGLRAIVDVVPLQQKLVTWLDDGTYVVAILILLGLARRALLVMIEWSAFKSMPSRTLQQGFIPLMRNLVTLFVFLSGGIMVLKHFNYDVMSLLTALGVGSLAVGLAAKETLSNMISGFTLIIDRNLSPGDTVKIGDWTGDVDEIGLRSTRIRTGDGKMLIVPNSDLVNSKLVNLSLPAAAMVCTSQLRVPFSVPFERVREICLRLLSETEGVSQQLGKAVLLTSLAEGHQLITVVFWVGRTADQGSALSDFHSRLLAEFAKQNISLIARNLWL